MAELSRKLGEMEYDGLIADPIPVIQTAGAVIGSIEAGTTIKRGTVLGKSAADGKLAVLGTDGADLEAYGILCDDITAEIEAITDAPVVIYTAGCFNSKKISVAEGYSITAADIDTLRKYGIVLKTTLDV